MDQPIEIVNDVASNFPNRVLDLDIADRNGNVDQVIRNNKNFYAYDLEMKYDAREIKTNIDKRETINDFDIDLFKSIQWLEGANNNKEIRLNLHWNAKKSELSYINPEAVANKLIRHGVNRPDYANKLTIFCFGCTGSQSATTNEIFLRLNPQSRSFIERLADTLAKNGVGGIKIKGSTFKVACVKHNFSLTAGTPVALVKDKNNPRIVPLQERKIDNSWVLKTIQVPPAKTLKNASSRQKYSPKSGHPSKISLKQSKTGTGKFWKLKR